MKAAASYILVKRDTSAVIGEIFNSEIMAKVNREKCEIIPIKDYLVSLNKFIYNWETGSPVPNPAYRVYGKTL